MSSKEEESKHSSLCCRNEDDSESWEDLRESVANNSRWPILEFSPEKNNNKFNVTPVPKFPVKRLFHARKKTKESEQQEDVETPVATRTTSPELQRRVSSNKQLFHDPRFSNYFNDWSSPEDSPRPLKEVLSSSPIKQDFSVTFPADLSAIQKPLKNTIDDVQLNLMTMAKPDQKVQQVAASNEDDDDIMIIEESKSSKRKRRHSGDEQQHVSFDLPKELCSYHRQTVTEHDYKTLADGEFLNDNIINFYLTWLYESLNEQTKDKIHIYSSHFYSRLKSRSEDKKRLEKNALGVLMTQAERSYNRVKGWTKKIDIFSKRMLIVPICEESHWYLVIVCNPGCVLSASREKHFEAKRTYQQKYGETKGANPFIMVLDSLGGSHSSAVSKIRSYLSFEHLERQKMPLNFGKEKMGEKHPPIPLQPNSCDCGLFLLHYVELIFKDPDQFLGAKLPDLSQWFKSVDIDYKREDIAVLIQDLAKSDTSESSSKKVKFPTIKFPARRPRRTDPRLSRRVSNGDSSNNGAARPSRFTFVPTFKTVVKDGDSDSRSQKLKQSVRLLDTLRKSSSTNYSSDDLGPFPPIVGKDDVFVKVKKLTDKFVTSATTTTKTNRKRFTINRDNFLNPTQQQEEVPCKTKNEMYEELMKGCRKKLKK